ncbi:MAG: YqgE/AlgH family protein [Planctomycetaceae bacterium]|jgi:putative transcriptional regulator|nr:YqgE/AlgH family protein [Planctomycetaceae bacterium]
MGYAGNLLIASPHLDDQNFSRTVVLLVESNEGGTIGLVLNRVTDRAVRELWEVVFQRSCKSEQFLRIGGPVFGPLMALHTQPLLSDIEVSNGIHFSTDRQHLETLVENNIEPYSLFMGNAGWGQEQLTYEIKQGAWFLLPASSEIVFGDTTDIWKQALLLAGSNVMSSILGRTLPDDASLN